MVNLFLFLLAKIGRIFSAIQPNQFKQRCFTEERELIINFIKEINKTKANLEIVKQKIYASQIN